MSQNTQNLAGAQSAPLDAVDQGIEEQGNATPDQGAETSNDGSNVGTELDTEKAEQIAAGRSERAAKAALKDYYKQQGLTEAEATQAFEAYKQNRAQKEAEDRNNLGVLQQQNAELKAQAARALETANKRLINADAKTLASTMGVKPDRVDVVVRLANLKDVTVDEDGSVDKAAVKKALEEALKLVPELKQTEENRAGFKIGGGGQDNQQTTSDKLAEIFGNKKKEK